MNIISTELPTTHLDGAWAVDAGLGRTQPMVTDHNSRNRT
jgi:hypothetical protein